MQFIPFHFLKRLWNLLSAFVTRISYGLSPPDRIQQISLHNKPSPKAEADEIGNCTPTSPSDSNTSQTFPPTEEQIKSSNQKFINSINKAAVCELVSRHNSGKRCQVVNQQNGSFNVCFFVQFDSDDTTWVLRMPISPAVCNAWDKLVSEVITMRYIKQHTSIPIPTVYAYGRDSTLIEGNLIPFILMEFIQGQQLDIRTVLHATKLQRRNLYVDLINALAQLRRLDFPFAGSLLPNPNKIFDSTAGPALDSSVDSTTLGPFLSITANEFIRSGGKPIEAEVLTSVRRFIEYHCHILSQTYKLPVESLSHRQAKMELFALHSLFKEIPKRINFQNLNEKYVLAHPDLRCGNIIVTGDLHILGIIDWEFTGAIPLQLFTPPSWIMGHDPSTLRIATGIHRGNVFPEFCGILKEMCRTSFACTQLWHDWGLQDEQSRQENDIKEISPLMQIFRQPCNLIQVYYSSIFPKLFGLDACKDKVISEFFAENKNWELLEQVEDQIKNSQRYTGYLRKHNLLVEDSRARLIQEFLEKTKFLVQGEQT